MRTMHRLFTMLGAAAVIAALGAPTAWATDDKVFPGIDCVRASGGNPTIELGRLANSHTTSAMDLQCPIVRDNTLSPWFSVAATVIDQTTAGGVCMRAHSRSPGGSTGFSTGLVCSTGNGSQEQNLTLPPLAEFDRGCFFVRFSVPARQGTSPLSGVGSYRIAEF